MSLCGVFSFKGASMNVSAAELSTLLEAYIPQRFPVLITGAPGIGKSDIVAATADKIDHDLLLSHPAVEDPTNTTGLPFPSPNGDIARFLPFGDLAKAMNAKRPLLWFMDDLGQATPAVQAAKMQLLLARQVGEHKLPDCVTFVSATNRRVDNAGVSGLLEPVISRFVTVVNLEPSIVDWTAWAVSHGLPTELIAFLRFRPDLLLLPKRTRDIENCPSPRTWGFLAKTMPHVPKGLELISYAGSVGDSAAAEFIAFLEIWKELPSPAAILLAPHTAQIPEKLAALYATVTALAVHATAENFDRVMIYMERLFEAGHQEFGALLARDSIRRTPDIQHSCAFIRAQSGQLGRIIQGS